MTGKEEDNKKETAKKPAPKKTAPKKIKFDLNCSATIPNVQFGHNQYDMTMHIECEPDNIIEAISDAQKTFDQACVRSYRFNARGRTFNEMTVEELADYYKKPEGDE